MLWNNGNPAGSNSGYPWTGGSHDTGFDRLTGLLESGINGAKDGAPIGQEPLIMIHHDKGADWSTTRYYFDQLTARELEFDVIGYSYYPKFHYDSGDGDVADVANNLNNTAERYGKPVVLVETGFASRGAQWEPDYEFDVSTSGQTEFMESLVSAIEDVPNDLGWGLFWWYAEARPTNGLNVWEGGRYGLFDQNGNALPALDAFNDVNLPGDYNGDGYVNAIDLERWSASFGSAGNFLAPDGDQDGDIDGADFLLWQRNLTTPATTLSVPEPHATTLFAFASMLCLFQYRLRTTGRLRIFVS